MAKFRKRTALLTAALMAGALFASPSFAGDNDYQKTAYKAVDLGTTATHHNFTKFVDSVKHFFKIDPAQPAQAPKYYQITTGTGGDIADFTLKAYKADGTEDTPDAYKISYTDEGSTKASHEPINNQQGTTISINEHTLFKEGSDVAVKNAGTITNLNADFINNSSSTSSNVYGGAIYNKGTISSITGDFINNSASSTKSAYGGAIYNTGTISITGDFINNSASGSTANGGAIYNTGTISITGDFINNSASGNVANGGAIFNNSNHTIDNITGDFINNSASSTTNSSVYGGAIYNVNATINSITGDFTNNSASSTKSANGGAIHNTGTISITGDFINNSASGSTAYGGAISNSGGTISIVAGDKDILFSGNYVKAPEGQDALGGAIYNGNDSTIGLCADAGRSITFVGQSDVDGAQDVDGIYNTGTLNINGYTPEPTADNSDPEPVIYGGTVSLYTVNGIGTTNIYGGTVNVKGDITQNIIDVKSGATLASTSPNVKILANANLTNDGTISMSGDGSLLGAVDLTNNGTIDAFNVYADSSLTNNNTINATGIEVGDILTNNGTINAVNLLATKITNNGNITTTDTMFGITNNNSGASLTVNGKVNSGISTAILINEGNVTINGDAEKRIQLGNSGTVNFNGKLDAESSVIQLIQNAGVINFSADAVNSTANLPIDTVVLNGGTLNFQNNSIGTMYLKDVTLNNDINLMLDADLAKGDIDSFSIGSFVNNGDNHINITGFKILSDADTTITSITDDFWSVAPDGLIVCDLKDVKGYSPIYKYDVKFGKDFDGDNAFVFTRYSGGKPTPTPTPTPEPIYEDLNPAIMAAPVAAQMGGYLNLINSYDDAFASMDMTMLMTSAERTAMKMRNKYAAADEANLGTYNPNQIPEENAGVWFRPYASFEKVNLNNGPEVGNNSYGGLIGADSRLFEFKHGWDAIFTGYAGYNGSHQHYDGNSIWQNGGQLGGTAVFYKGNFFTGLTATVGASVADASNMFGKEYFTNLMAGVANKTGYNWELFSGRFIIQPSLLLSYSFVNTFDYNNAAGVRISSDPLHAIQLAPGLKFIGNLPHGWQPYIGMQMVWNIMDKTRYSANDVSLPETSIDPYFQYGVGLQKRWGERFTGFAQVMLRNGGRTGISLSGGFRWALGKKGEKLDSANGIQKSTERNISLSIK